MRILIWKYKITSLTGGYKYNYFQQPQYYDFINIENILYKDFPLYKEAYNDDEDGVNGFNFGYQSIFFSMNQPERSAFGNSDIYSFLTSKPGGSDPLFLFVIDNGSRISAGTAHIDDIEVNKMWGQKGITVDLTSIEKEATDYLASINLAYHPTGDQPLLETYLRVHHFKDVGALLTLKSEIADIHQRVNGNVRISSDNYNGMWEGGLNRGYSVWEGLKSIIKLIGCRFRVTLKTFNGQYPTFNFVLHWRTASTNRIENLIYKPVKERYIAPSHENLLILTALQAGPAPDTYKGILIMKDRVVIYEEGDGGAFQLNYQGTGKLYVNALGGVLPENQFTRIDIPMHANNWLAASYENTIFARILHQEGRTPLFWYNNDILEKVTAVEYGYLLAGSKKRFEIESYYDDSLRVGTEADIEGVTCICEEISESSEVRKIQKGYWIEK
ncbi:MAG: hypothetical protein IAE90_07495 [Ignavibacteria bacterium]|nr:hypothetical protein [Ignavibacteria bacterium]